MKDWSLNLGFHRTQLEAFKHTARFKTLVCGRRYGKSTLQVGSTLFDVLAFPELMPDYDISAQTMETVALVGMPTLKQARRVLWKPLVKSLEGCPLVHKVSHTNFTISFHGNRPDIYLVGLNDSNGDRARGLKIWRATIDEIQDVKRETLEAVIFPAMADTPRSHGFFTGTPKGKANVLYELYQRETEDDDWKSFHFHTSDNPFVPRAEIERAKRTLPPRLFRQEFESSFESFEGQIYSEFDPGTHVVGNPPWDDVVCLFIGIDPGDVNPAMVLVAMTADNSFFVIDTYQPGDGSNAVPEAYLQRKAEHWCTKYPGVVRTYVDPSRPGVVLDLRESRHIGLQSAVSAYNSIEEGNQTVNNMFFMRRLSICTMAGDHMREFVNKLQSYHRKKDKNGNVTEKVADGQDDHEVDALRYVMASLHNDEGGRYTYETF